MATSELLALPTLRSSPGFDSDTDKKQLALANNQKVGQALEPVMTGQAPVVLSFPTLIEAR